LDFPPASAYRFWVQGRQQSKIQNPKSKISSAKGILDFGFSTGFCLPISDARETAIQNPKSKI
jgi:hypothetical protein